MFRSVPKTGVIYVMTEAVKHGYTPGDKSWVNLGQGAPEVGHIPGCVERLTEVPTYEHDLEYSAVEGLLELREAVADLYNQRYRVGKSQYNYQNVSICAGGRLALTRVVANLGKVNIGHFIPDYTAYEELLDSFGTFVPIPIPLKRENGYRLSNEELRDSVSNFGLKALIMSNPANPTGAHLRGEQLKNCVETLKDEGCALVVDEFYSHFVYGAGQPAVSAAEYVDDIEEDAVVIIDGLTKNWRYPGFRISWTVGPKKIISGLASAGSFMDGGASRPIQRAAVELVKKEVADQEANAIQQHFLKKRDYLFSELTALGVEVVPEPQAGFYCWGKLDNCKIKSGYELFEKALEKGVITVPGRFFDINPGQRRAKGQGRLESFSRFSFGPSEEELSVAISKLKDLL